eukprot:1266236-Alexandrium_andersonii.AAC.1
MKRQARGLVREPQVSASGHKYLWLQKVHWHHLRGQGGEHRTQRYDAIVGRIATDRGIPT